MSDQPTRIRLCRELEVEIGGRRIEHRIRGSQGRMLLAYLVLHRDRPVRRSELEDALWEETRPAAPDALAPPLSRLRSALGADRLTGRTQLRLELGDGAWIDVEAAERAVADARAAVSRDDPEAARAAAEEAIAIASGGLMSDLEADWLVAHRTRVDDLHVDALELAATAAARQGGDRLADAERLARAAVERAPFRESARVVLLDVLGAQGNVAEGLLAFEDARRLLRDELGAVPGPPLLEAHDRLLALDRRHGDQAARRPGRAPWPQPLTLLVGRER